MTAEPKVKAALQLGPRDRVEELGVFPQPASVEDVSGARLGETWTGTRPQPETELISLGAERSVSVEPAIQASLPRGRAMRVDDVPGVLVLEDIPEPKLVLGPIARTPRDEWVADTRRTPAVLVMDADGRELVFWGEEGRVRLFVVERVD